MRVLITGGAGFIGSHLSARLLAGGHSVTVLDDLSAGDETTLQARGARFGRPRLHVGSTHDLRLVDRLVADADAVVHLAASVGVRTVVEQPTLSILNNTRGNEVVFERAAEHARPVIYASSSEVYGKSDAVPFREDADLCLGPTESSRWSYACNKALGEWLLLAHARERALPATVVRLFNTVGPGQSGESGMVLPRFVHQALEGRPLTVHGDGSQTRCFAHVRDVADVLAALLERGRHTGEVLNVGGSEELSIAELASRVRAATGSRSDVVHVPYERAYGPDFEDLPRRVPDLARLRAAIGFVPTTSLETILADVLAAPAPGSTLACADGSAGRRR